MLLIDDLVGETEQRRDGAEGEPGRHQQRRVHALASLELVEARQRQDAHELGDHLERQEDEDEPCRADDQRVQP